jgi:conjugative transfer region protein TrbK
MGDQVASPLFLRAAMVLGCGVLFLAVLFAFQSNDRADLSPPFAESPNIETMNLRDELLRCDALGPENTDDQHCNAVWAENNRRFFKRSTQPVTNAEPVRQPKIEGARHE